EHMLDALIRQRPDHHLGAGHLCPWDRGRPARSPNRSRLLPTSVAFLIGRTLPHPTLPRLGGRVGWGIGWGGGRASRHCRSQPSRPPPSPTKGEGEATAASPAIALPARGACAVTGAPGSWGSIFRERLASIPIGLLRLLVSPPSLPSPACGAG